jgi:hypothetical protein
VTPFPLSTRGARRRQASHSRREAKAGLLNGRERERAETTVRVATGKEDGCRGSRRLPKSQTGARLRAQTETGGIPTWGYPWGYPKNVKDNDAFGRVVLKKTLLPGRVVFEELTDRAHKIEGSIPRGRAQ